MTLDKRDKKVIIVTAFTLICFFGFLAIMGVMIVQNGKCVDNPFRYSAIRLNESGGNYACQCNSLDPKLASFTFDEEGIEIIQEERTYNWHTHEDIKVNFSEFLNQ